MLSPRQREFVTHPDPYPAFVGGYGSGKTTAAIARLMSLKTYCSTQDVAYYLPTYSLIEDIAVKRIGEICEQNDIKFKARIGTSPHIEIVGMGKIILRSMDNPERIIGYEVAHSIVDELDTMPLEKARVAWNKIIARNRQKNLLPNSVGVVTTPEGFRFVYERWVKNKTRGYTLIKARTSDNVQNLPSGYIDNLKASYSEQLLAAYLDGEFVNMTFGSIYYDFDRRLNASFETIRPDDALHIGLDFNVGQMAAVIFVLREGNPHAVDEITGGFDTPAVIQTIKNRYPLHRVFIYPDASGGSRKSQNASISDIKILRDAGFIVLNSPTNPAVRDRILSVNAMIHINGERRMRVNPDKCPAFVEALEKQAYDKNGEPDKSSGLDHVIDAGGYFIAYKFPIRGGAMLRMEIGGI